MRRADDLPRASPARPADIDSAPAVQADRPAAMGAPAVGGAHSGPLCALAGRSGRPDGLCKCVQRGQIRALQRAQSELYCEPGLPFRQAPRSPPLWSLSFRPSI